MSIQFKILGKPGKDNALMVWIDSGKKFYRLLFDCGEDLLKELKYQEITSIDHLFFSHLHLDHAAGFDYFFRRNYDRSSKPVYVWGPEKTIEIIHNRLNGFTWNLVEGIPGTWFVNNINENNIVTSKFLASEGFAKKHRVKSNPFKGVIIDNKDFKIEAVILNHIIPSIAYRITEKDRININKKELELNQLEQGPWLEKVKDLSIEGKEKISFGNKIYTLGKLRELLIVNNPGASISYLSDFIYDRKSKLRAKKLISNCTTVICESQYSNDDVDLAKKNFHLTTVQAAELAKDAQVKKLILFHISERYKTKKDYPRLLKEAGEIFPETSFPDEWGNELQRTKS